VVVPEWASAASAAPAALALVWVAAQSVSAPAA
jgi:hypothetical protein